MHIPLSAAQDELRQPEFDELRQPKFPYFLGSSTKLPCKPALQLDKAIPQCD